MMTGILKMAWTFLRISISFAVQFLLVLAHWLARFLSMRRCNWKKCRAQKEVDKAMRELGAEVYFLSAKEEDWRSVPAVKQQLARVEEAEGKLLAVQELSRAISRNTSDKLERIKARYVEKRARIRGTSGPRGE